MTKSPLRSQSLILLSIPFLLLASIFFLVQSQFFAEHFQSISAYFAFDLLFTIPLIYFLIIRKTNIPNTTVIPMMLLGLLIGYAALPNDQHYFLDLFKSYGLPLIEISVLVYIVIRVRSAVKLFNTKKGSDEDFYNVLEATCREIIPGRLAHLFISEISVIYYGFFSWKKPNLTENDFTYHKRSGSPSLFGALVFIILVETVAVHILLMKWSHLAALILSILSIYTGIQLLGFGRSLSRRPIMVDEDKLILRYGIMNETTIIFDDIESIELSRRTLKLDNKVRKLSLLGDFESHNVIVNCKRPQIMLGIYGITNSYSTLAFYVDEKERFAELINSKL